MPSPFAITAASNGIQLDSDRRGEVTFTVFNASGRALRARARIVAQQPPAEQWVSLRGEPLETFPIAGMVQYAAVVEAPPTAEPGNYTFRLDVIGEDNPDEDYTEGPSVTFEVPRGGDNGNHFPWWIVAVVAAVLVIGGIVAFILFRSSSVEVPNVAGMSLQEAVSAIDDAGLAVADATQEEPSDTVPFGNVVRTEPPIGESVEEGTPITLVLSTGPPPGDTHVLSLTVSPPDAGTIAASPAPDDDEAYDTGTEVNLTVTPAAGFVFDSWSGDPDCADNAVVMDADKSCTANLVAFQDSGLITYRVESGDGVAIYLQPRDRSRVELVSGKEDAEVLSFTLANGGVFAIWVMEDGSQWVYLVVPDGTHLRGDQNNNRIAEGWTEVVEATWSPDGQRLVVEAKEEDATFFYFLDANGNLLEKAELPTA